VVHSGLLKIINIQHHMPKHQSLDTETVVMVRQAPHPDLLAAQALAYGPRGLEFSDLQHDAESADYGACTFVQDGQSICFRVVKTTPTKTGQFVTLWKRTGRGPIQPFDAEDEVDVFVVSCRSGPHFGQFVFTKAVLAAQG
jgi:hypothetical protein